MTLENKRNFPTTLKLKQTKLVYKCLRERKLKEDEQNNQDYFKAETEEASL